MEKKNILNVTIRLLQKLASDAIIQNHLKHMETEILEKAKRSYAEFLLKGCVKCSGYSVGLLECLGEREHE